MLLSEYYYVQSKMSKTLPLLGEDYHDMNSLCDIALHLNMEARALNSARDRVLKFCIS